MFSEHVFYSKLASMFPHRSQFNMVEAVIINSDLFDLLHLILVY